MSGEPNGAEAPKKRPAEYFRAWRAKEKARRAELEQPPDVAQLPDADVAQPDPEAAQRATETVTNDPPAMVEEPVEEFVADDVAAAALASELTPDPVKFDAEIPPEAVAFESAQEAPPPEEAAGPDITRPPKRFSTRLKQRWTQLPDWLREDIVHAKRR
jgi:hypothetical protein